MHDRIRTYISGSKGHRPTIRRHAYMALKGGLEPPTTGLTGQRSTIELL